MHEEIIKRIKQVEDEEGVNIFYACESGSRAWGFPSTDSDYDVRFIYVKPIEWYLSIDEKRDVIEKPINDEIDLNGWDIKKALKLFRKSNPPLLEWIRSPIVYIEMTEYTNMIRELIPDFYSAKASIYHYLHMAQRNFREYLQGDMVWVKKYLYALRPVLGCRWIEQGKGAVPMEFAELVNNTELDKNLIQTINELVERKKQGEELRHEPKIPEISDFLDSEIVRLKNEAANMPVSKGKTEKLDSVFRKIIDQAF